MSPAPAGLRQRRHLLITMLTACAWRDSPGGPSPVAAGIRGFLGGWLGIDRIVVGMARQGYDLQLTSGCGGGNFCPDAPLTRGQMAVFVALGLGLHFAP